MTTIAYDGKYLAADGRTTNGGTIVTDDKVKIIKLDSKIKYCPNKLDLDSLTYLALSGDSACITPILDYIYHKIDFKDLSCTCLLFTKKYVYRSEGNCFFKITDDPIAIGSGAKFALTAMKLGKSAKEAVEIACQMDIYSGGKITVRKVR